MSLSGNYPSHFTQTLIALDLESSGIEPQGMQVLATALQNNTVYQIPYLYLTFIKIIQHRQSLR
jgi:hypothetical protein